MLRKADVSTAPIGPEAMAEPTRLQDKMTDAARAAWVDAARDILIAGGIAALNLRGLSQPFHEGRPDSVVCLMSDTDRTAHPGHLRGGRSIWGAAQVSRAGA